MAMKNGIMCLRLICVLPISISNSYLVAYGVSDRKILKYPTSTCKRSACWKN